LKRSLKICDGRSGHASRQRKSDFVHNFLVQSFLDLLVLVGATIAIKSSESFVP